MKRAAIVRHGWFLLAGALVVSTSIDRADACDQQARKSRCAARATSLTAAPTATAPSEQAAVPAAQKQEDTKTVAVPGNACGQAAASANESGMRAHLDPESGVIGGMPPVEPGEITLDEPILEEVTLPDGSVMIDLKGTHQEYYVMKLDANGRRVVECVKDAKAVPQAAPTAKPEER